MSARSDSRADYALTIANATLLSGPSAGPVAPVTTPAPSAGAAAKLTIATKSAKLRRLRGRRLPVVLRTTAALTGVKVFIRKGSKVVARGSLRRLATSGRVRVKLGRKVKPGRYVISASGVTTGTAVLKAKRALKLVR